MRVQLAEEQRQLCCYCTGAITRGNFHIEHFCPRDADDKLTYTWSNLLASCQGLGSDLVDTRRHCGAAKDNWFVEGTTVSPLKAGVESLFRFPLSGKMYPNKDLCPATYAAVDLTISHLHLNAPSLVARRAEILARAALDTGAIDCAAWRTRYLNEHDGKLQEFWPALSYNFTRHWRSRFDPQDP